MNNPGFLILTKQKGKNFTKYYYLFSFMRGIIDDNSQVTHIFMIIPLSITIDNFDNFATTTGKNDNEIGIEGLEIENGDKICFTILFFVERGLGRREIYFYL